MTFFYEAFLLMHLHNYVNYASINFVIFIHYLNSPWIVKFKMLVANLVSELTWDTFALINTI